MHKKGNIKLVHLVTSLDTGGMENGIINLCNRHDRGLFEVKICCLKDAGPMSSRLKADVELVKMGFPEKVSMLAPIKVAKYFRAHKPDIVHTHGLAGGSYAGILGAKIAGVSVVVNGEHGKIFSGLHQVLLQRMLAAICNQNLTVSLSLKNRIVKNLGIKPDKIKVIPNGVDTDIFTGNYDYSHLSEEVLEKHGIIIDGDSVIIGSVGSLKPEKNQMLLLKALKELKRRRKELNLKVLFVGDGPDRNRLADFIIKNGLSKDVAILGIRKDIPQILSLIDILASTSISGHEGMSNVILEAMASGVSVISTRSTGMEELVSDGLTGFLIDNDFHGLADKIELLSCSSGLRDKIGNEAGVKVRKEYSIAKMVSEYENLYTGCLTER